MNWLRQLFGRAPDPEPRQIAELLELELGQRVQIVGQIAPLALLHSPLDHEPAVVIHYRGRPTSNIDKQTPFAELGSSVDVHQATSFVLSDPSGAALIEIDPGVDVDEVHQRLLRNYGAALDLDVEIVCPGDHVRIQGRMRERSDLGSPHRREAWVVVVVAESVELVE